MTACINCQQARTHAVGGGDLMTCVNCCARLVKSARPWGDAQETLLAVAGRYGHGKDSVLAALKAMG